MAALTTPTPEELREFYPISTSIPLTKIDELANVVKNHLFVDMFGFEASQKIYNGDIPDGASATFIGFQKFFNLCCAYWEIRDPLVSTNFGAKIIDRIGAINPSNNQKSITIIPIEKTISIHYKEAIKLVINTKCQGVPDWGGYFSYKTSRL